MTTNVRTRDALLEARVLPTELSSGSSLLEQAMVATLVYHDLLEMPLTAVEIWRFLLRPRGIELSVPSLRDVQHTLSKLTVEKTLGTSHGYYTLLGREALVPQRIARHARAQEKWKRLRRIAWWLQAVPFLRMVAGSGSLARDHVRDQSDLDVLVVAETGKIWTVRFLLTLLLDTFGVRRRPTGPTNDLVCLNHYVTLDHLRLPYRSVYTAYEYARLVPLLGEDVLHRFRAANAAWMQEHLVQLVSDDAQHRYAIRPSRLLRAVQRGGESLLGGAVGTWLETVFGRLQHRRITQTHASSAPGRIVATASHLEFHPQSREAPLTAAFNARMAERELLAFGEQSDSGLDSLTSSSAHST